MIYTHVAAALLAGVVAFGGALKVQDWRYGAREAERLESVRESTRMAARAGDMAATSHEADKVEIRTEFKTIYRDVEHVVEKPIYLNVCFDDDGLRVLAAATRARSAASKPAGTVP